MHEVKKVLYRFFPIFKFLERHEHRTSGNLDSYDIEVEYNVSYNSTRYLEIKIDEQHYPQTFANLDGNRLLDESNEGHVTFECTHQDRVDAYVKFLEYITYNIFHATAVPTIEQNRPGALCGHLFKLHKIFCFLDRHEHYDRWSYKHRSSDIYVDFDAYSDGEITISIDRQYIEAGEPNREDFHDVKLGSLPNYFYNPIRTGYTFESVNEDYVEGLMRLLLYTITDYRDHGWTISVT